MDNDPLEVVDIGDLTEMIGFLYNYGLSLPMCETAGGAFVGGSSCKSMMANRLPSDTTPDFGCLEYSYDEAHTLTIKHINAGFNCCPVLAATVHVENFEIIIQEIDSVVNPCACLCLFDMDYLITNLQPGTYHITVIEPYLHQDDLPLDFELDLSGSTSGIICQPREYYPWGVYE